MSLINQMLKDLAQRAKTPHSPDVILSGLATPYSSPKKNKFPYWFIATSLFLIVTAISFIIQQYFLSPSTKPPLMSAKFIAEPHKMASTKPLLTEEAFSSLPLHSTMLTGITLQAQQGITTLRLLLNQPVLYRITGDGTNRLMIVLEHTQLTADLPQLNTLHSAIKNISMKNQENGNLAIILMLNAGTVLQQLALNETGRLPELQIDLLNQRAGDDNALVPQQNNALEAQQEAASIKKFSYNTSIENEYQQAMSYSAQGQDHVAIARLTKFLEEYPAFIPARKSLATLLLKEGHIDEAQQVINIGLQQQPLYPPYIQFQAQILVDKGKLMQALKLLETALPPLEENPEYHAFIAALYQRQNKFMLAEKLYERLLNLQPNNSLWWMGLGIARESLSKKKEALAAYTRANNTNNLNSELKTYVENRINALL